MRRYLSLFLVLLIAALSAWTLAEERVDLPSPAGGRLEREGLRMGLDIKGGTHLVLQADLSRLGPGETAEEAMAGVVDILQRRVDAFGVTEPIIQRQPGGNRVLVQLPGVQDINQAVRLIGQTAQLDFRELSPENLKDNSLVWKEGDTEQSLTLGEVPAILYRELTLQGKVKWLPAQGELEGQSLPLTGKYLKRRTFVDLDPNTNEPEVNFEWDGDGAKLFEQITSRMVGKPLGIFLDDDLISSPTVRDVIRERGVITGLTLDHARMLAIQLNAGALPVPLEIVQQQDVDAFLGSDSLSKSLRAGAVGVALLLLFMLVYYRLPGLVADLVLLYYGVLVLALFKLIPVTLTLSGIAGFIISLGMAVDANVLVLERMKEELRGGRALRAAVEVGFSRAWSAIRDSNITTLIVCVILYWFGGRFGAPQVMGFALTLGIGILVSMFSAMVVTRSLLRLIYATPLAKRKALFVL